jgi:dihydroorotate dehydrogenase electron transfer subunit
MNLVRAKVRTLQVLEVVTHAPLLASLYLEQTFEADPGQFVNVWIPGLDEKPFSISDLSGGRLELTVKGIGPFSRRMAGMKAGEWLGIRGPFGHGFSLQGEAILVAGGSGLAPIRFLAKRLAARSLPFRLAIGVRTASDLIFPADLGGAELMSDDGSLGGAGLVTVRLAQMLATRRPAIVYGAGPEPMLLAVRDLAERAGVPYELSLERYMKCGFGICGQCCLDGLGVRVCTEGPVLKREDLEGVTDLGKPHRTASGRRAAGSP